MELTRLDYEDYLISLYFGLETDILLACINRAYRDFNRTLHGLKSLKYRKKLKEESTNYLKKSVFDLKKQLSADSFNEKDFDNWHEDTCEKLISIYTHNGYSRFTVGQAQKWINMTFKYIFTYGEQRVAGFGNAYPYCHVPIDQTVLKELKRYNFPKFNYPWSRIDNYNDYLEKQIWVRHNFDIAPLDVEFKLWLGKELNINPVDSKTLDYS